MSQQQQGPACYICDPRYVANASANGIPVCTVCAWQFKITTDQERAELERRTAEERQREADLRESEGSGWNFGPPSIQDDIPF